MQGEKLKVMSQTDMRYRRSYTKLNVEEERMAFRLETFQYDCRANMPIRCNRRDLRWRACCPRAGGEPGPGGAVEEDYIEDQEHLEGCKGYANLLEGMGPYTPESRCRYFMRIKLRRLQQQQQHSPV